MPITIKDYDPESPEYRWCFWCGGLTYGSYMWSRGDQRRHRHHEIVLHAGCAARLAGALSRGDKQVTKWMAKRAEERAAITAADNVVRFPRAPAQHRAVEEAI
jgi:hypothetical protein